MSRHTLSLALAAAALLSACGLPTPAQHAQLHITSTGSYELDHSPISIEALPQVLAERHARYPDLQLQVRASPQADIRAVQRAVQIARQAQVRLAFADEGS